MAKLENPCVVLKARPVVVPGPEFFGLETRPVAAGDVMRAFAVGEVVASRLPGYAEGERVLDGLAQAPGALRMLYRGENRGKLVIRVDEGPDMDRA